MVIAPRAFALAALLSVPALALAADYDEGVLGDLSNDPLAPTSLGVLAEGPHTVSGTTTDQPLDADFFTFEVAPGTALASIVLDGYSGPPAGGGSFLALEDAPVFSSTVDASGFLGTALIGRLPGSLVGEDVLDDVGTAVFGGAGFTGELGPGTYTLWYQETGGPTGYAFTLNIVPAPGAAALLGLAGIGATRRRRA